MFERCEFNGITPRQAKRRALNYWFTHRSTLGMSVADFFRNCRVTDVGGITRITFYGDRIAA